MATSAPPSRAASETSPRSLRHLGARSAVLFGLAGMAMVQPLLDLFGSNPEFFVFKRSSDLQIVAFGLIIAVVVPLVAVLPYAAAWSTGRRAVESAAHVATVAALAALYGLVLARQLAPDSDLGAAVAALVVGGAATAAIVRLPAVAAAARYLAAGPLLFLLLFLATSPVARLLWSGEAEVVDAGVGDAAPVVVVVLDELPLSSIITPAGTIDAARFPGFASMAASSTWYRNASANAPSTTFSVPALLSGMLPSLEAIPTSVDHPRNLFTLLGATYELDVHEEVTALCPTSLCGGAGDGGSAGASPRGADGIGSMLQDAWVVGRHLALPPALRDDLPALDAAWGGFLGQDVEALSSSIDLAAATSDPTARFLAQAPEGRAALAQGARLDDLAARIEPRTRPTLWFTHLVLPHQPWEVTQAGTRYSLSAELAGMRDGRWSDDARAVVQGFQRHLLQVGYADRQLGRLVASLQASGLWDEAVVIVVADHGVGFGPGALLRKPTDATVDELYRVPLLVHVPGQAEAVIDDRDAMLIDVVPTLVELLEVDVDWTMDGRSLLLDDPPSRTRTVRYVQGPTEVSQDTAGLLAAAARNAGWVGAGWSGTYAVGDLAALVGTPLAELDVAASDERWGLEQAPLLADLDPAGGFAPVLLTGDAGEGTAPGGWFIVAVDGIVAGVGFVDDSDRYTALVDEARLHAGAHDVVIAVPAVAGDGTWWSPQLPEVAASALRFDGGRGGTATLADGATVPIVPQSDRRRVRVDRAVVADGVLAVGGWSLDLDGAVPEQVLLVADGTSLPTSQRRVARADLARAHGDDVFLDAGFELVVTGVEDVPDDLAVVSIYADAVVWQPVAIEP